MLTAYRVKTKEMLIEGKLKPTFSILLGETKKKSVKPIIILAQQAHSILGTTGYILCKVALPLPLLLALRPNGQRQSNPR